MPFLLIFAFSRDIDVYSIMFSPAPLFSLRCHAIFHFLSRVYFAAAFAPCFDYVSIFFHFSFLRYAIFHFLLLITDAYYARCCAAFDAIAAVFRYWRRLYVFLLITLIDTFTPFDADAIY